MVLSKEKTDQIIKKINEAIKRKTKEDLKCPICTNNNFLLAGGFTNDFLMDGFGGGLIIGGPVLPSVPIVCTNCGNTIFLNVKVLDLSEEEFGIGKKEKENKKDEQK
ncbi:MAG: hypothetical protein AABW80_01735 [Nanoarchaeota archaeon]